jgi:site-specific recombinase XerD
MSKSTAITIAPQRDIDLQADLLTLLAEWHASLDLRVRTGELSPASRRTYVDGVKRFFEWCSSYSSVTDDVIREWLGDLRGSGCKPASINTWLSGLRAFFAWAVGARRIPYNPASGIKSAKRSDSRQHKRDALTNSEVRRVLAMPDETPAGLRDRAIIYLMAYTAARTVEVHRADLEDLSTKANRPVLKVRGKGRAESDEVIVIANSEAEGAMHDWISVRGNKPGPLFTSLSPRNKGGRLSLSAIRGLVKSYYNLAGVVGDNKTTHSLRHSAISNAIANKAPIQKARAMARHRSIDTTMIYVHESDRVEQPAEQFIDYRGE